jgi:damage-control phosphatase, subfamily I
VPCFINQVIRTLPQVNESLHQDILRDVLRMLSDIDFSVSPPEIAKAVFDVVKKHIGEKDLYAEEKIKSNRYILNLEDELRQSIADADDSFMTGLQLAIAGNIIDFGAKHDFSDELIHSEIDKALNEQLPGDDIKNLKDAIDNAERILYLGDNAGEIVFDKLFIEQLPKHKVTFAVRGAPVINDALMADAEMVGMDKIVPVVDNGSAMPGTVWADCSEEFKALFSNADLIIAKGQGNYETLSQVEANIYFLLKAKCVIVAKDLNRNVGDFIIKN